MSKIITLTNRKTFKELYDNSAYTITGCAGNLKEWTDGYNEMLKEEGIGQVDKFYSFTGGQMNDQYHLKGNTRYPNDLQFLAFKLDGLDVGKLAMFKLLHEDRWFDDIVDNNARNTDRSCVITI